MDLVSRLIMGIFRHTIWGTGTINLLTNSPMNGAGPLTISVYSILPLPHHLLAVSKTRLFSGRHCGHAWVL